MEQEGDYEQAEDYEQVALAEGRWVAVVMGAVVAVVVMEVEVDEEE